MIEASDAVRRRRDRVALVASARHTLFALVVAVALPCSVRAQDAPRLSERLGLEGPLDNDTRVPTNSAAQDELARGDAELDAKLGGGRGDVGHRTAAFEAWRRALTISSVLDVVEERDGALASVSTAVRRRIVDLDRAEFAARFAGAAQVALDAAGDDLAALERVTHENPFTAAGARASLRRCDLWIERGERARARAALESDVDGDPSIGAARAKRLEFLGIRAGSAPSAPAQPTPTSMILTRTLEMPAVTDTDLARRLEPGIVFADGATRAWIMAGERLVRVDDDERVTSYELEAFARPLHASWLPAFGDRTRAWSQTPALDRDRLVVVAGRAREERGNALLALDVDDGQGGGGPPTVRWAWSDSGFTHRDGTRAAAADTLLPGRLEFQPGPLLADDLVIVQVLQWTQAGVPEPAQRVDETDTTAWLVAFDATSGRVAWRRELARGADTSARDAARMSEPRRVSTASLPLARVDDVVLAVTELGTCSLVRAGDGAWLAGRRLKRAPRLAAEALPIVRGGVVACAISGPDGARQARFAFVASDAGAVEYVVRANTVSPRRVDGILRPVAVNGAAVDGVAVDGAAIVRRDDRIGLVGASSSSTDADRTPTVAALPFARGAGLRGVTSSDRGILCASGDEVLVYDPRRELMRTARATLDGLDEEPFCGLQCRGARVYVVGLRRTWILELR